MTDIGKSTLNNIDNEKVSPTLKQLEAIAKALNVKITDLFESEYKWMYNNYENFHYYGNICKNIDNSLYKLYNIYNIYKGRWKNGIQKENHWTDKRYTWGALPCVYMLLSDSS